ncbi:RICIN domain-containing protein [Hymenobacter negativus]|uniref:RICIN domain-containing protein n=1 Tax=Hymenobacter negativus TaxID=2795026 RepID=A0ABS3QHX9_9BACT|nr:RICIN domain-containing protein [Hymenobacter negativus]MBO2010858.1 RICIN domain-containing protein [Hymenobacter negativus]
MKTAYTLPSAAAQLVKGPHSLIRRAWVLWLVCASLLPFASQAQAQFPPAPGSQGLYRLYNPLTGLSLEIGGGGGIRLVPGCTANLWTYDNHANQQWLIKFVDPTYVQIINRGSGQVLEIGGYSTAADATASQYIFGPPNSFQEWRITNIPGTNRFFLTNRGSSQALQIAATAPSTRMGEVARQQPLAGTANQQWELIDVSTHTDAYTLTNLASFKVAEVNTADVAPNVAIEQRTYHVEPTGVGQAHQQWYLRYFQSAAGHDYWVILNRNSTQALQISGTGAQLLAENQPANQAPLTGALNQQWEMLSDGGMYYHFINRQSGLALSLAGGDGSTSDGDAIAQSTYEGLKHQTWLLDIPTNNRGVSNPVTMAGPTSEASSSKRKSLDSVLTLYPNPTLTTLYLSLSNAGGVGDVTIRDIRGTVVSTAPHPTSTRIDVSHLPAGIYFVTVTDERQEYHQKFIKQ